MRIDRVVITAGLLLGSTLAAAVSHAQGGGSSGAAQTIELAPAVTFEVTELRRIARQGVTELKFVVANDSGSDVALRDFGMAYASYLTDIDIIDFAAQKAYSIGDASGCLCSTFKDSDGGVVRAGERRQFWAWYAGLPTGTKEVAIKVADQPPLMNLAVQ